MGVWNEPAGFDRQLPDIADAGERLRIHRLRAVDQNPFCIETSYTPNRTRAGAGDGDLIEGASRYALLSARYPIEIDRDEGTLSSVGVQARRQSGQQRAFK
jgi:GntR family transcriptional regulator